MTSYYYGDRRNSKIADGRNDSAPKSYIPEPGLFSSQPVILLIIFLSFSLLASDIVYNTYAVSK